MVRKTYFMLSYLQSKYVSISDMVPELIDLGFIFINTIKYIYTKPPKLFVSLFIL